MKKNNLKIITLLLGLSLPSLFCQAGTINLADGLSHITVKESHVEDIPRGSTIQASIDGHYLTVTFTQDIGTLTMELDRASGSMVLSYQVQTPDSFQFYLPLTDAYIITFTLSNGDEYFGEFTVTN